MRTLVNVAGTDSDEVVSRHHPKKIIMKSPLHPSYSLALLTAVGMAFSVVAVRAAV